MKFVVLLLAVILAYYVQHNHFGWLVQIRTMLRRGRKSFIHRLAERSWRFEWPGLLLWVVAPAGIIELLVVAISGQHTLPLLLLNVLVLAVVLAPVDPHSGCAESVAAEDEPGAGFSIVAKMTLIFFYLILGVAGAVAIRMLQLAMEEDRYHAVASAPREFVRWLPARLLVVSYALVGNFHAVLGAMAKDMLRLDKDSDDLLQRAELAALAPNLEDAGDGRQRQILISALHRRAILAWLAVIAIASLT